MKPKPLNVTVDLGRDSNHNHIQKLLLDRGYRWISTKDKPHVHAFQYLRIEETELSLGSSFNANMTKEELLKELEESEIINNDLFKKRPKIKVTI